MGRFAHACVTSQLMGKEAARAFPVKRNNRGRATHLPSVLSPISELPFPSSSLSSSCLRSPPSRLRHPSFLASRSFHGTQDQQRQGSGQGCQDERADGERVGGAADAVRLLSVDGQCGRTSGLLQTPEGCRTGGETTGHPSTRVILAAFAEASPNRYPFFVDYFSCGLCPPFSDFFNDIMHTYGFHLLDFTPNAVACMALFAHLYEGFA